MRKRILSLMLCCGMQVNIFRCVGQGIGFNVDFSQVLIQFSQGQLDRRFHRIGVNRWQLAVCNASCHTELSAEHRFGQFQQNSVLGRKQIQIASPCHTCLVHNLTDSGVFIPLLQKETDAYGQYFPLCFAAVSSQIYHLSSNILVFILIISQQVQKDNRYLKLYIILCNHHVINKHKIFVRRKTKYGKPHFAFIKDIYFILSNM